MRPIYLKKESQVANRVKLSRKEKVFIAFWSLVLALGITGLIWLAAAQADAQTWGEKPGFVVGPADWRLKEKSCIQRATIIGGFVEYVADSRYCVVKN